jgi:hypothetical protein
MATLDNPITPQNIVDRFADYVVATANTSIAWGTDVYPFGEWTYGAEFGGTTAGKAIGITGSNVGTAGDLINAANIYNTLLTETATYTNIRNLRAILFVDGDGGNTGSRPTAGAVFDTTAKAHFNSAYLQSIGAGASNVVSGSTATAAGLETFFNNLRTSYNTAQANTVTLQVNVCHASCHSNCHSSRGRR